ncbi:MAG TPA: prephenate dehydratase domain-containing protein [Candidatus Limnocylindrales bacterium]|nr:prephenate dehydratase domain-containing protein [Candidatus Limnocylindrales bacterium]
MQPTDTPRVVFAGEHGAFAEDAVLAAFLAPEAVPVAGFRDVFEAVAAGRVAGAGGAGGVGAAGRAGSAGRVAGRVGGAGGGRAAPVVAGVLPIENVAAGTVREVYDLLLEHELAIAAEVIVPVRLCLAALPGEELASIERVYSHVQALGQADAFLRSRPWTLLASYNTAGAGRLIAERHERGSAAVLSPRAAALFGLSVLADDIQGTAANRTRFLVLVRPPAEEDEAPVPRLPAGALRPEWLRFDAEPPLGEVPMRTTLALSVRNEPGSLHRCLGVFASAGLNMSKLESRPSRAGDWEYVFWIDLDADVRSAATRVALAELDGMAAMVRILGCYPRGEEPAA